MNTTTTTSFRASEKVKKQPMDVYKEVTKRVVLSLSEGDIPWRKPWNAPYKTDVLNYKTRKPYSGINRLILREPGEYLTFNQCREAGGHITKGSKGHLIVKYGFFVPKEDKEKAELLKKEGKDYSHLEIPYLKHDWVYHISQTEGVKSLIYQESPKPAENPVDLADFIINEFSRRKMMTVSATQVDECTTLGNVISVPLKEQFRTEEEWYNAVFVQMVRSEVQEKSSDTSLSAKEELAIEIGASMVLNAVGLTRREASENTEAKCREWMSLMNKDVRIIINASSQAEKIAREIVKPLFDDED